MIDRHNCFKKSALFFLHKRVDKKQGMVISRILFNFNIF